MKKTLVVGASSNPYRYAYKAVRMLKEYKHPVTALGLKKENIEDTPVVTEWPAEKDFDTVTLYVGPQNQSRLYEQVLSLAPKRVIFNPGAENPEFADMLKKKGIETLEACTLVLLRTGQF
jgi:predicted CoA-binding protein